MYKTKPAKPQQPTQPTADRTTEAFLREVDEAMHEEKIQHFWRKWRGIIVGTVALIFLAVVGTQGYLLWSENRQQAAAAQLYAAQDDADLLAELVQSNVAGIRLIAQVKRAQQLVAAGEAAQAVALYEDAALNAPERLQYLLKFYAAMAAAQMDAQTDLQSADSRLAALDVPANPFQASVLTMQAELLEQQGDRATALTVWEKVLTLETATATQRERAQNRRLAIEASL